FIDCSARLRPCSTCMLCRPPGPTLFPYTTLFRSELAQRDRPQVGGLRQAAHPEQLDLLLPVELPAQRGERFQADSAAGPEPGRADRKSTRLNSSHVQISYAVICFKKKKQTPYSAT